MDPRIESVLQFWFGPPDADIVAHSSRWWRKDPAFDEEIRAEFGPLFEEAASGKLEEWVRAADARAHLALIVLLDQFSRNLFRGKPRAFAQDAQALAVCEDGCGRGLDRQLSPLEAYVFYMPLMHAEDREVQQRSVQAFNILVEQARAHGEPGTVQEALRNAQKYAVLHAEVIERFGRFPHRNAILGRISTPEETAFLLEPNSSF
jgi:uncharacterized protein (DUF924 family)